MVVLALVPLWKGVYRVVMVAGVLSAVLVLGPLLVLFLMLPGTQVIARGFYRYQAGPIAPPLAFTTFLFLSVVLAAAVLNLAALRLLRRQSVLDHRGGGSS